MSKDQIVSDAKAALVAGQDQLLSDVLGSVYDKALGEVPPVEGGPSEEEIQARIDAAVAAKIEEDAKLLADQKALDDQALADAKAASDAAMADFQKKFDELASKELDEKELIDGLKGSLDTLKSVVEKLQAIFPAPAPEPQPVPEPQPEIPVEG